MNWGIWKTGKCLQQKRSQVSGEYSANLLSMAMHERMKWGTFYPWLPCDCVCMCRCGWVCAHVFIYVCVHACVCVYVRVSMYVHMIVKVRGQCWNKKLIKWFIVFVAGVWVGCAHVCVHISVQQCICGRQIAAFQVLMSIHVGAKNFSEFVTPLQQVLSLTKLSCWCSTLAFH